MNAREERRQRLLARYRQNAERNAALVEQVLARRGETQVESERRARPIRERPGLGDYTERLLASIGVTKDRYVALKEKFGLAPTCGCADRKAWLNKVSDWWRGEQHDE